MGLDNDTRGWIMSCVSGIACVLGSSIICIDIIARNFFRRKNFNIIDNVAFLSASMSLSAGVLIFTSLYSMLPTSQDYLIRAGYSSEKAAYILVGLFLLGVVAIRLISGFIHRHIPSHVVGCSHSHNEHAKEEDPIEVPGTRATERSPLLQRRQEWSSSTTPPPDLLVEIDNRPESPEPPPSFLRTLISRPIRGLISTRKARCDDGGPCYGFSSPCGRECLKIVTPKDPEPGVDRPGIRHSVSAPPEGDLNEVVGTAVSVQIAGTDSQRRDSALASQPAPSSRRISADHSRGNSLSNATTAYSPPAEGTASSEHHHHVPQNAFLSIGLQTSLAIALHKLPEGFITYATNHTNPTLGWSVFVALFIHNITEGFAMALPLYLALQSRLKAMAWSSLLGGISQPAGAGIAALWIWYARRANENSGGESDDVSWAVYGGMFAATAGVMTNVALQLFSEGLVLSHNQSLCIGFAIGGMGILGLSFALTA